jgi:hypothetical protein
MFAIGLELYRHVLAPGRCKVYPCRSGYRFFCVLSYLRAFGDCRKPEKQSLGIDYMPDFRVCHIFLFWLSTKLK